MCLIVFSYKKYRHFSFILAANRDEFYKRPTEPVHIWQTSPKIIAGKDEKEGGTWLGISENGRFAALTNYRKMDEIKQHAPSRGHIITNFLLSGKPPLQYLEILKKEDDKYNGFNLIAGTFQDLYYISNKKNGVHKIEPGIHSLSNAFLNTPWPKTEYASQTFEKILDEHGTDEEKLFTMLQNNRRYPVEKLPNTGLPKELEKAVSSPFIQTDDYGTRSSTLVIVDSNYKVQLIERSYIPGTKETEQTVRYSIDVCE